VNITKEVTFHVHASGDDFLEAAVKLPRGHKLRERMVAAAAQKGYFAIGVSPDDIGVLRKAAKDAGVEVNDKGAEDGEEEQEEAGGAGRSG
jgi:hypothetical protein